MVSNERWKSLALNVSRAWTRVYLPPCPGIPPEYTLMPPLCHDQDVPNLPSMALCSQPRGHQPACGTWWLHEHTGSTGWKTRGLCLWQSGYRNCRNQHISHFLTKKYKNKKIPVFQNLLARALLAESVSQGWGGPSPKTCGGLRFPPARGSKQCLLLKNQEFRKKRQPKKKRKPMRIDSCFQFFSIFK